MIDMSEFESISPYTDAEAAEALSKLAEFPLLSQVSQQFFPNESPDFLKNVLNTNVRTRFNGYYISKLISLVVKIPIIYDTFIF